jgi:hypothetical protein
MAAKQNLHGKPVAPGDPLDQVWIVARFGAILRHGGLGGASGPAWLSPEGSSLRPQRSSLPL